MWVGRGEDDKKQKKPDMIKEAVLSILLYWKKAIAFSGGILFLQDCQISFAVQEVPINL